MPNLKPLKVRPDDMTPGRVSYQTRVTLVYVLGLYMVLMSNLLPRDMWSGLWLKYRCRAQGLKIGWPLRGQRERKGCRWIEGEESAGGEPWSYIINQLWYARLNSAYFKYIAIYKSQWNLKRSAHINLYSF